MDIAYLSNENPRDVYTMALHLFYDPVPVLPNRAIELDMPSRACDCDCLVRAFPSNSACMSFRRLGLPRFGDFVDCDEILLGWCDLLRRLQRTEEVFVVVYTRIGEVSGIQWRPTH